MNNQGDWLSIIDYSVQTGLSISTLRRRIKSGKIEFQEIGGKYFIRQEMAQSHQGKGSERKDEDYKTECLFLRLEVEKLQRQMHQMREENNDLRMLVDLYEGEKQTDELLTIPSLPELPSIPNFQ